MHLKNLISFNLGAHPLYNCDNNKNSKEWARTIWKVTVNNNIEQILSDKNKNKDDLYIITLQEGYGYRVGLLGYLAHMLSYNLSQTYEPTSFQRFLNKYIAKKRIHANDFEITAFYLSILSRTLPFLNLGIWDIKNNLKNHIFKNIYNSSHPSIFDFKSLFCLNPIFDSGCAILSNRKAAANGFEKWSWVVDNAYFKLDSYEKMINKGITWAYFESGDKGIVVINFDLFNIYTIRQSFEQVIKLEKKLRCTIVGENIVNYEIYITFNDYYECSDNDVLFFDKIFDLISKDTLSSLGMYKKIFYKKLKFKEACAIVDNNYQWTFYKDHDLICINKHDGDTKEKTDEPAQEPEVVQEPIPEPKVVQEPIPEAEVVQGDICIEIENAIDDYFHNKEDSDEWNII